MQESTTNPKPTNGATYRTAIRPDVDQDGLTERLTRLDRRLDEIERLVQHLIHLNQPRSLPAYFKRQLRWLVGVRIPLFAHHEARILKPPRRYFRTTPPKNPPTFSIVTPSYQQGEFIERTLASVLDQKYPNLEYVVQDGGSSDDTLSVLKQHSDRLFRWESKPDRGQSNAINLGFRGTTGEIMAYLNSDDMLAPGSLNYVAQYFNNHPEVDVVFGHRWVIDIEDLHIGSWVLPPHRRDDHLYADFVPQETMFWRRRIWDKVGGIDESFRFAMDWDLILRFREAGAKFVRLPRFLGMFRVHREQKTNAMSKVGTEEMDRIRKRVHGCKPSAATIREHVAAYLKRHALYHTLYLLGLARY